MVVQPGLRLHPPAYLLNADYLAKVSDALPVADGRSKARMQFLTRQYIDALAPSNFAATNPEFIQTALATKGESITQGIKNLIGDMEKGRISMTDDSAFEIAAIWPPRRVPSSTKTSSSS